MFKNLALLALFVVAANADAPAPQAPPQVYCGEIPSQIYGCLGMPQIVSNSIARKCKKVSNSCDKMTCLFRESGWLNEGVVDQPKVSQYLDGFFREHAAWAAVAAPAKACVTSNLPPQGIYLNCPAYDVMMCMLTAFIRGAQPTQWGAESCAYARSYAGACPVCPSECFAPAVPTGSCNACLSLPRSP